MTETTVAPAAADADAHPSQIIHDTATNETPRAGSLPEADAPKEPPKPISTRDAIAKAFDDATKASEADKSALVKADEAKAKVEAPVKADAEPKADKARDESGKFAKADPAAEQQVDAKADKGAPEKAAEQAVPERRQSEGRHPEPPARFLPEARSKWANVPNEVKAEFHRVAQEMEQETGRYKASHERYETLKPFDDLARSNGRDLRESLTKINEIENALRQSPIAGLDAVLREIGPRKQDGSPLTIMDVAQYLSQNPQAYRPDMSIAQQAQQPQSNQELEALKAEVQTLRAEQTVVPVIQRFADAHPDFDAISGRVTEILSTGVIEKLYGNGLSLEQKLSEAYRMAGGQGPSSRPDTDSAPAHSDAAPMARPVDPDGQKSIKGAPTSGQTGEPKWKPKSNREALERAFASAAR